MSEKSKATKVWQALEERKQVMACAEKDMYMYMYKEEFSFPLRLSIHYRPLGLTSGT